MLRAKQIYLVLLLAAHLCFAENTTISPTLQAITTLNKAALLQKSVLKINMEIRSNNLLQYEFSSALSTNEEIPINSLTKTFTALAVLLLVEEGKLSLQDSLVKILPRHTGIVPTTVTIQDLLNHTSGLTKRGLRKQAKTERFYYSNRNYALLAEVIANLSGSGYPRFMEEKIFLPLGMLQTTARPGYSGDAGIRSTVHDLQRFATVMINNGNLDGIQVFSSNIILMMREKPSYLPMQKEIQYYGYGLWIKTLDQRITCCYHRGRWEDGFSAIYLFPESGTTAVILGKPKGYNTAPFLSYIRRLEKLVETHVLTH